MSLETHRDLVSIDLTFHLTVPVDCAFSIKELTDLLRGKIDSTPLCPAKKADALCNQVDELLSKAWFCDGRKFDGVDIQIVGIEEEPLMDEADDHYDDRLLCA